MIYMGNENSKIPVIVKKRQYKSVAMNVPYGQLAMIRVLQREFNYEVKGTIYVDSDLKFKSFEVRTDNSELYSYGASDWKISFHTHPDSTAQKYGVRYYSPPSVDDIMEIYEHSTQFVPDSTKSGLGELSIVFANEGIYVLQVNRESFANFNKENMPLDVLEEILNETFSQFMVSELKKGIAEYSGDVNMEDPQITVVQFTEILQSIASKVSTDFGFDMKFHSWKELEAGGLNLSVWDYFLNKKVDD